MTSPKRAYFTAVSPADNNAHENRRRHVTWHDVFVQDMYVVASVWPSVFVPESDHVTQLVDDYAELVTVLADRDCLRSAAAFPDERATPIRHA